MDVKGKKKGNESKLKQINPTLFQTNNITTLNGERKESGMCLCTLSFRKEKTANTP